MYKVIKPFTDMQDNNHVYFTGDEYPRKGAKPGEERIAALASNNNKLGYALLREVKDAEEVKSVLDEEPQPKKATKSRKKAG